MDLVKDIYINLIILNNAIDVLCQTFVVFSKSLIFSFAKLFNLNANKVIASRFKI